MTFDINSRLLTFDAQAIVVAGFTGRDDVGVRRHLDELAAQGVLAPPRVPTFYLLPPAVMTRGSELRTVRSHTSGEAEIALVVDGDEMYVTLASDHTDRGVETMDIALSKEVCSKPIARRAWRYGDVADRWDALRLRSWVQEDGEQRLYQDGHAGALLAPEELLARMPLSPRIRRFIVLTGTLPALGGVRPSKRFRAELREPRHGKTITLEYDVRTLDPLEPQA